MALRSSRNLKIVWSTRRAGFGLSSKQNVALLQQEPRLQVRPCFDLLVLLGGHLGFSEVLAALKRRISQACTETNWLN